TFTGWWMATGALAATIKTRKDTLSKVEGSIPSSPQTIPNDRWSTELAKINDQQQALVTTASRELWERQKARMSWPPLVDDFAKQIAYRGEFPTDARELYRTNYLTDAERVWRIVRPIMKFDSTGIVDFPGTRFPMRRWGELAPTSLEMWDAQEDLWLLEPLLEAIRDLNGDESATRLDAAVYTIEKLELVGGLRGQPINAPAASSDSGGALMGDGGMAMSVLSGGPSSGGNDMGGGSLAGAKFTQVTADFNYKEEFGDGGDPPWKAGRGGGMQSSMSQMFGAEGGGAPAATESTYRRYVDDDAALPYKTRGFYLSVVMDHRRVPELIAALTANGKSDWPVEIVRVQVARVNSDDQDMGSDQGMGGTMANYNPTGGFTDSSTMAESLSGSTPFGGAGGPGLDGGGVASQGFESELKQPMSDDEFGLPPVNNPNAASFQNVLKDPFVAKVALCGLIYLYNPVEPPPPAETTAPASDPAVADPSAMPADPAATPADGTPGETPATTAPTDGTTPADPATATPAAPANDPTVPATPETEAAPATPPPKPPTEAPPE
ncbi:MAG TPA: hypothetical protein VM510_14040, partial [Caulifigura sp.]|nr:hypothetical protein [Caulifigura sp.]